MSKIENGYHGISRVSRARGKKFAPATPGRASARPSPSAARLANALEVTREVAGRVYGPSATVRAPELRRDRSTGAAFHLIVVEIARMDEGEFIAAYDAFMEGVGRGTRIDPEVVTLCVQIRGDA